MIDHGEECDDTRATDDGDPSTSSDVCRVNVCKGVRNLTCGDCGDSILQWREECSAADALFALRATVGLGFCDPKMCDVDYRGGITAADALFILREATGLGEFVYYFDLLP